MIAESHSHAHTWLDTAHTFTTRRPSSSSLSCISKSSPIIHSSKCEPPHTHRKKLFAKPEWIEIYVFILHTHTHSKYILFFANESLSLIFFCNIHSVKFLARCVLARMCLFNANTQKQAKPFCHFHSILCESVFIFWNFIYTNLGSFLLAKIEREKLLFDNGDVEWFSLIFPCRILTSKIFHFTHTTI